MRMSRRHKTKNAGFTLVEVMTAMGILVAGMSTILGLLSFGLSLHRSSGERGKASLAAESVIAEIRQNAFLPEKGKEAKAPETIREREIPAYPGLSYSATFRENPQLLGEYLVEVQISWKEKGKTRSTVFRTVMLQEIPYEQRLKRLQSNKRS